MFRLVLLLGAVAIGFGPSPAEAQDPGSILDPTIVELYRFETMPSGAAIFYNGAIEGFTDVQIHVKNEYLKTITLVLEGYLPCPFSDGVTKPAPLGIMGNGVKFRCRLVADPSRPPSPEADEWTTWPEDPSEPTRSE